MKVKQYTEDSLTLLFGEDISPEVNKKIVNTRKYLDNQKIDGIIETIISYTRLVIYFDVLKVDAKELLETITQIDFEKMADEVYDYRVVEIPVCYEDK